mmetsp:Transcript_10697/g.16387  ORF Transcript_10697/g.16387 Transcript_10697/m.16387 type:complete len:301 (-) Transcript_10697:183-1085(-)
MLRKSLSIFISQHQYRHHSSASHCPVVSRGAWKSYQMKYPSTPAQKKAPPKNDEKPWPRNMVLFGYAATSIFVPYSIAWYLSMNKEARQIISSTIPGFDEALRSHFGVEEQISYQDAKIGARPNLKFVDEEEFAVRTQQEEVDRLAEEEVSMEVHIYRDGASTSTSTKLPGTTMSKSAYLSQSFGSTIALDFDDLTPKDASDSFDMMNSISSEGYAEPSRNAIYSSWYYQSHNEPAENRKFQIVSAQEIEMSRLEYTIDLLEKELQDINSTRDLDDVRQELMEAKSELRSLRWKRRLGLS